MCDDMEEDVLEASLRQAVRAQYHFRTSEQGLLAWDVRRLIRLSRNLPVQAVALGEIAELDRDHWYGHGDATPTVRSVVAHCQLMMAADLAYPILLDPTWGATTSMLHTRSRHTATRLPSGDVLIVGGSDPMGPASAELYSSGVFAVTGQPSLARAGHSALLLEDGRVMILGGDFFPPINSVEAYVGGVLSIEPCSAMTAKSMTVGVVGAALPRRSSRTMTITSPAGPMFFWAPA